jgi:hypothetical protein
VFAERDEHERGAKQIAYDKGSTYSCSTVKHILGLIVCSKTNEISQSSFARQRMWRWKKQIDGSGVTSIASLSLHTTSFIEHAMHLIFITTPPRLL